MKFKFLSLFLVGLLLTGCGKVTTDETTSETEIQTQVESTEVVAEEETSASDTEADSEMETANEIGKEETGEGAEKEAEEETYVVSFTATTVDGEELTSECFLQSKITMLNVWATYCNPCLSEMPDLGEIASAYDTSEFQIIGIVSDVVEGDSEETVQGVKDLIEETKADYPHVLLSESLYMNLVGAVDSVPTTFFVNQKGEMLGYVLGAQSKETWEGIINELLAEAE